MGTVTTEIQKRVAEQYIQSQCWLAQVDVEADPEALHQYRVCLRRARSLLGLYRIALRHTPAAILYELFAEQAKVANHARDLDVFYLSLAPSKLQQYIGQLRSRAYQKLQRDLSGLQKSQAICHWLTQLAWPIEPLSLGAATDAVRQKLKCRIGMQWQKLTRQPSTSRWHKLRILLKRWRYLEALCGDESELKFLKSAQQRLGDFNDLCFQLALLAQLHVKDRVISKQAQQLKAQLKHNKQAQKQALSAWLLDASAKNEALDFLTTKTG